MNDTSGGRHELVRQPYPTHTPSHTVKHCGNPACLVLWLHLVRAAAPLF